MLFHTPTDLGHQTAQRVVHASDPLQSMQEISQNFPSIVSSLSRMKVCNVIITDLVCYEKEKVAVRWTRYLAERNYGILFSWLNRVNVWQLNDSVKDEIIANQRMIPPGKSLMAINGALINIEDIDLYL